MLEQIAAVFTADLAIAAAVTAVSGLVHGYSGFGAGLVMVPLLSLLYGPVEAVAVASIAAVLGSAQALPGAARIVLWREVTPVTIAALIAGPLGVVVLLGTDPEWIRRGIGLFVLAAAALIMSGWVYRGRRGVAASAVTGAVSGVISGVAGVGGPPLVVYFLAADQPASVQRANIVVTVVASIVLVLVAMTVGGAIDMGTLTRAVVVAPFYIAAFRAGGRLFAIAPETLYRKVAIGLLVATGLSALVL